ncbi:MAG: dTDP-4-dehydrorhamnose 3,5-epimerase [Actinomycetota bacterium]
MIFGETRLRGAFVIELEPHEDERGFFARTWDADVFAERGLDARATQASIAYNERRGTLRGLHYQLSPFAETKLVRCTQGAIWDVIVDLRPGSETLLTWVAVELTAANRRTLYVPEGFAHGYQTLVDATEVWYQMSTPYTPDAGRGVPWDDPQLAIEWPEERERVISDRDRSWPDVGTALAELSPQ